MDNFLIRLSLQGTQLAVDSVKTRKGNEDEEFQERDVYYLCHRSGKAPLHTDSTCTTDSAFPPPSATHPSRELPNESTGSQDKDDGEASQTGNEGGLTFPPTPSASLSLMIGVVMRCFRGR